jgi:hypothetical protein
MNDPYEFQETQGGDYQVGFPLKKTINDHIVENAYIPFGLAIDHSFEGGSGAYTNSFSSAVQKKAMEGHVSTVKPDLFDQLFDNITKPVGRKNKTIRRKKAKSA